MARLLHIPHSTTVRAIVSGGETNGNGNPHTAALKLVERFTPVDAGTLRWEVTVDDPQTWTRPWTFAMPLKKDATQAVFEYACHEGNYAMRDMLSAVRHEEQAGK